VTTEQAGKLRLGVSACLLGNEVRYDGGHKRHPFLTDLLAPFVEWVPVCPEVEAGFGTPREAMRLVRDGGGDGSPDAGSVRLVTVRTRRDVTDQLEKAVTARLRQLPSLDLDGYVLKKDSPSCGLFRVKVYGQSRAGERSGRGLFAEGLVSAQPLLPLEEEGRLSDPRLRENFIERVFAYRRLRELTSGPVKAGELMRFHARHKLLLLAHAPAAYARLGRLVASVKGRVGRAVLDEYAGGFMDALTVPATRGRHVNVLQHMAGYFDAADDGSRRELAATIADYGRGLVPLVVPLTLIAHHVRRHDVRYLLDQVHLQPHPTELMLRNSAARGIRGPRAASGKPA
jgi:uncharacterized protein YbgA (DUF1722 family)/uncharacterized protein YbbK (DUF523 family)